MSAEAEPIFVLGEKNAAFDALRAEVLETPSAVRDVFSTHRTARWLARRSSDLTLLVRAHEPHDTWHRLLLLEAPSTARRELLGTLFRVVVAPGGGVHLIGLEALVDVLGAAHPEDLFIGGVVDAEDGVVVLYRGNLERLVVPLSWFRRGPRSPRPDFQDFEIIDSGQTVRFGEYEAAAAAIVYDFDADSRRRFKNAEIERDDSFGGALRRLRLARELSRDDFPGVSPKTIARIERGEVERPRDETLSRIAEALGVRPEEIEA